MNPSRNGSPTQVNLGLGMPQDAIVCDRAFNTRETTNAFLGYEAVEAVEYDPRCECALPGLGAWRGVPSGCGCSGNCCRVVLPSSCRRLLRTALQRADAHTPPRLTRASHTHAHCPPPTGMRRFVRQ